MDGAAAIARARTKTCGPPQDRRRELLELYEGGDPTGGNRWWIAPTPAAAGDIRRGLTRSALSPGVMTVRQAADLLTLTASPPRLPLGPAARRELVAELTRAADRRSALGPLEGLVESPGLVDFLASRFRELRREGIGPDEAVGALLRSNGPTAGGAIARLYRDYLAALDRGALTDDEGIVLAACERVATAAPRLALLVIDLAGSVVPIERQLIDTLAEHAERVVEAAPGPPSATPDDCDRARPAGHGSVSPGIAAVRGGLFADDADASAPPAGVEVIAGDGQQQSVRQVARRVKRLLLEGRVRPQDIVLAAPRLEEAAPRMAEVFAEVGVPLAVDAAPRLGSAPLVGAAIELLTLAESDWAFPSVVAVLGRCDLPALAAGRADGFASPAAAAEWFVRDAQFPSGRRRLRRRAESLAADQPPDPEATQRESARRLAQAARAAIGTFDVLDQSLALLPTEAGPLQWVDSIDAALRHLGRATGGDPADRGALDALEESAAAIESLARWRGRELRTLRLPQALALLRSWGARLRLPRRESPEGRVRLVGVRTAPGLACRWLFVVGADEAAFAPQGGEDASDAMNAFWDLCATPSEGLVFAYAARDDAGQPLWASPYVTDVERLFPPGALRAVIGDPSPVSRREARAAAVERAILGDAGGLLAAGEASLVDGLTAIHARATGDSFGPWEGVLGSDAARGLLAERYGPDHLWSASQLELIAECPFKFFAKHGLRLAPVGEVALAVDHRRRGSLVHDAFAAGIGGLVAGLPPGGSLNDIPHEEVTARLAEELQQQVARAGATPYPALLAIDALQTRRWAERYAAQQANFADDKRWAGLDAPLTPRLFEARFGPAGGSDAVEDRSSVDRPLVLRLPDGAELRITGRIDRIDVSAVGGRTVFSVIDYKTSRELRSSREQIESGRQLQPVLYALAAQGLFFGDAAIPVAAGYWGVRQRGFVAPSDKELPLASFSDGAATPSDEWLGVVEAVRAKCAELVAVVRRGEFPMNNPDPKCGERCDFRTICRVAQARSLGKVAGDAAEDDSE